MKMKNDYSENIRLTEENIRLAEEVQKLKTSNAALTEQVKYDSIILFSDVVVAVVVCFTLLIFQWSAYLFAEIFKNN